MKIREGKKPAIYLFIFLAGCNLKQYEAADFAALRAVLWRNGFHFRVGEQERKYSPLKSFKNASLVLILQIVKSQYFKNGKYQESRSNLYCRRSQRKFAYQLF